MGTTTKNNTKYVSFLLDETGSMQEIKRDTMGGFNEYVETLKKDGGDIAFSLVSFNSNETKSRYVAEPIETVAPLTDDNYRPRAMTPLIDASVKIIKATAKAVKKRRDEPYSTCRDTNRWIRECLAKIHGRRSCGARQGENRGGLAVRVSGGWIGRLRRRTQCRLSDRSGQDGQLR